MYIKTHNKELSEITGETIFRYNFLNKETLRAYHKNNDKYFHPYTTITIKEILAYQKKSSIGKFIFRKIFQWKN